MLTARQYFEKREISNDDCLSVRKYLIKYHGRNDHQFGAQRKPYQLDVGPGLVPSITLHPLMEKAGGAAPIKTALSNVLQRGASIKIDPSGLRIASLKIIPIYWIKVLDKIAWRIVYPWLNLKKSRR